MKKGSARGSEAGDQLARAKARADVAWRAVQEAERLWIAAARCIKPDEWRLSVDGISDMTVRVHAACAIWWDFFGTRPASDSWSQLNDLKDAWSADLLVDPKLVREALIQIGYPVRLAERRVKNQESESATLRGKRHEKAGKFGEV